MWIQLHIIVIRLDKIHDCPPLHPRRDHPELTGVLESLSVDVEVWEDVRVY
jgi:hypothetical protein